MADKPVKTCAACGREFQWRKKWARDWEQVRFCSERCRRRRVNDMDKALEQAIIGLLRRRSGTICPSEAARTVRPDGWRDLMDDARAAARRLAATAHIVVLQRGSPVDPSRAKGPIRLGRGSAFPLADPPRECRR